MLLPQQGTGVTARRGISFWASKAASVAVAYLFAVQLILAAAVSAQMMSSVSGGATEICHEASPDASSPSPSKSSDAHGAFCAICAFAAHAPSLPPSTHFEIERYAHAVGVVDPAHAPDITSRRRDPRTSQGPPANA